MTLPPIQESIFKRYSQVHFCSVPLIHTPLVSPTNTHPQLPPSNQHHLVILISKPLKSLQTPRFPTQNLHSNTSYISHDTKQPCPSQPHHPYCIPHTRVSVYPNPTLYLHPHPPACIPHHACLMQLSHHYTSIHISMSCHILRFLCQIKIRIQTQLSFHLPHISPYIRSDTCPATR